MGYRISTYNLRSGPPRSDDYNRAPAVPRPDDRRDPPRYEERRPDDYNRRPDDRRNDDRRKAFYLYIIPKIRMILISQK